MYWVRFGFEIDTVLRYRNCSQVASPHGLMLSKHAPYLCLHIIGEMGEVEVVDRGGSSFAGGPSSSLSTFLHGCPPMLLTSALPWRTCSCRRRRDGFHHGRRGGCRVPDDLVLAYQEGNALLDVDKSVAQSNLVFVVETIVRLQDERSFHLAPDHNDGLGLWRSVMRCATWTRSSFGGNPPT